MPTKYEIPNVNDASGLCDYCGGSGMQFIDGIGWRGCQYCFKHTCAFCGGKGCDQCRGIKHSFYSELSLNSSVVLPDTGSRSYAGEARTSPPRLVMSRRR